MDYSAAKRRLIIGKGFVENVTPAMRGYEISGKTVLDQWFRYRRRDRTKPLIGDKRPPSPLEKIQPEGWLAEYPGLRESFLENGVIGASCEGSVPFLAGLDGEAGAAAS